MRIDLHNHTKYSDGIYTPEELINIAIEQNVDCFAITDHDSVFGCDEIQDLSKKYNINVISGMELSTYYKGEPVHIVCLFKDNIVPQKLLEFSINKKNESGIIGTTVNVITKETHAHRHLSDIFDIIDKSTLSDKVKDMSKRIFTTTNYMIRESMKKFYYEYQYSKIKTVISSPQPISLVSDNHDLRLASITSAPCSFIIS